MPDRHLGIVVQRYGPEIGGGAETHCRRTVERLARTHKVTVLTSCARDEVTWANAFPPGETHEGAVTVRRFPVERPRDPATFNDLSLTVAHGAADRASEVAWFRENGPLTPGLIAHLREQGSAYDLVLFWSFRYSPTFFGLPEVAERAVLVPTAEEDPFMQLQVLPEWFARPAGCLFLTPEERDLVHRFTAGDPPPSIVYGTGLDPHEVAPDAMPRLEAVGVRRPFALYLGRINASKGCEGLFGSFRKFRERTGRDLQLVLAGRTSMTIPDHPDVLHLGYVEDDLRRALLQETAFLLVPSTRESLNLALLETWNAGRPAIVNGHCRVLKGQVLRGNGGLYYDNLQEHLEAMRLLLDAPEIADRLGRQGRDYVERTYRWPRVDQALETFLSHILEARRGARCG